MIIYWTPVIPDVKDFPSIGYSEPKPVLDLIKDHKYSNGCPADYLFCPGVKEQLKNVFSLTFPVDYDLNFTPDYVSSPMYTQEFYDNYILVRGVNDKTKTISVFNQYLFIAESDVEIEITGCYIGKNDFIDKTYIVPGRFNISKWYRPLETTFIIDHNIQNVSMNMGDICSFIKIHTDEKVEFKKFLYTDKIETLMKNNGKIQVFKRRRMEKLAWYYELFKRSKTRKYILNEVKNNLLDD